jgi:hypothetical protein
VLLPQLLLTSLLHGELLLREVLLRDELLLLGDGHGWGHHHSVVVVHGGRGIHLMHWWRGQELLR